MEVIPAPLKGKSALVTGGSRGIGAAIALKLASQGCTHIAITYNANRSAADEVLDAIRRISPSAKTVAFAADLLDPAFGNQALTQTLSGLGISQIDIVISSAAFLDTDAMSPVASLPKLEWDQIMTANAWAPLDLARAAVGKMPSHGGRIIMLSSVSSKAVQGDPLLAYAASKAALDSVCRNLAGLWALEYGVTVNSISVGATLTDSFKRSVKGLGEGFERGSREFSLLKRHGEAEEVAAIVAFIASPDASWVVGNQIPANGGGLALLQS